MADDDGTPKLTPRHSGASQDVSSPPSRTPDERRVSKESSRSPRNSSQGHSNSRGASESMSNFRERESRDESRKPRESRATSATTTNRDADGPSKTQAPKYFLVSRWITENKYFVGFTTALTVYALVGDDVRLSWFETDADPYFDYIVICCIVVFVIEIVLNVLGRDDYFMGFFFILDVVSTATLVLDLSAVSNTVTTLLNGDGADNARTGRAARLGARMGRVVRVIRLVRILKLYKTFREAQAAKNRKQERDAQPGEEDDWLDDDLEKQDDQQEGKESRVGKKLSDITTRKVIILVLIMLLVLPLLQVDEVEYNPFSSVYGANLVYDLLENGPHAKYERELLHYVYFHNWFSQEEGYCPDGNCMNLYLSQLFWVGIEGNARNAEFESMLDNATISENTLNQWVAEVDSFNQDSWFFSYGWMPDWTQQILSSPWTQDCEGTKTGFSLLSRWDAYPVNCPEDLRPQEIVKYSPYDVFTNSAVYPVFYFDKRRFVKLESLYNIGITVFVCVVLCTASWMFSVDANRLVLNPVEQMIKRVEAIRDDPLVALKMADAEFKAEEIAKARLRRRGKERVQKCVKDSMQCQFFKSPDEPMETVILERTIIKLGSLLALGFGEAGANIIAHNMSGADSAGVNAMVPGTRVECITGVVRIRDFGTATEVLQAKIMTFVNQIAEIVHGVVNEFYGAPNKNNGDTFLIIWLIDDTNAAGMCRHAEMSIVAFSKILAAVHRSMVLSRYRHHPGLQQRLGTNCRVHLSFGLHRGWAIEGAVGSEFKIDASYLSPNVSVAMSIELATVMYDVSILVGESVVTLCEPGIASKCRLIDKVNITGSREPMELFSVDLDYRAINAIEKRGFQGLFTTRQRFKARQFLENVKEHHGKIDSDIDMIAAFEADPYIATMRRKYTVEFLQLYNMGYQNYREGEWKVAQRMLEDAARLVENDGPCKALLRFMDAHRKEPEPCEIQAPADWTCRDLRDSTRD